jgi:Fic family protein
MEPLLPSPGERELSDLVLDLAMKSQGLAAALHAKVQGSVGRLVRSMNCYYSNLIEGHETHPRDIDRALAQDYSGEPRKRALQQEAVAHIAVQQKIDEGEDPPLEPASAKYLLWLHEEFCGRLPEDLQWLEDPESRKRVHIRPGKLRDGMVVVGRHLPPRPENLEAFLARFEEAYTRPGLSTEERIVGVAAAHHRLLWIHPFFDGNGRVARLMAHAMLKRLGIGSPLWSVARELARRVGEYKSKLADADEARRGDLDGRGSLSERGLVAFCRFFLAAAIDQVDFMTGLLRPTELLNRIRIHAEEEVAAQRLPKGGFALLREAVQAGEFDRGRAPELTGYRVRQARKVLSALADRGLLVSDGPKKPVRLGIPLDVVERWFPSLYPSKV